MKTQYEIFAERIAQLLKETDDDALPHIIQMIEAFAKRHPKKTKLRLVVGG